MPQDHKVKVIYILGWVRSGSTLLDTLLGEIDGLFSCGELRYLWDRGLVKGWMCGCGRPLPECDVWGGVLTKAFGRIPARREAARTARHHLEVVRTRRLVRILRQAPGVPSGWAALDGYLDALGRVYRAIAQETGSSVLIDSSKFAQDAALLRLVEGIDPYYVHLVRDPRAVTYSNMRRRTSQPDPSEPVEMALWSPRQSALRWTRFNLAAEAVRRRHREAPSMRLRYEDLIGEPRKTVARILELAGEPRSPAHFVDDVTVRLGGNHTVWGNPSRFRTGEMTLRLDDEWTSKLGSRDRLVCTMLAFPLLAAYGYPLAEGSHSHAG